MLGWRAFHAALVFVLAFSTNTLADNLVKRFPKGNGPSEVGIVPSDGDNPFEGPQAVAVGADSQVFLLDQVNHRVLAFAADKPDDPARTLSFPQKIEPSDLIAVGDRLFVWDQRPLALTPLGPPTNEVQKFAVSEKTSDDPSVIARFAQMGSEALQPAKELLGSSSRPLTEMSMSPSTSEIPTIGAGRVRADYEMSKGRDTVWILVRSPGLGGPMKVELHARDRFGTVQLLDVDKQGRVFVLAENLPASAKRAASTLVARFKGSGGPDAIYRLPFEGSAGITRRPVAITAGGDVLFLRSQSDGAEVTRLSERPLPTDNKLGANRARSQPAAMPGQRQTITGGRTRDQVVSDALAFEAFAFAVTPSAYGADPDHSCRQFANRVRRPLYLQGQLNKQVQGVPYDWGGMRSLQAFDDDLANKKLAGNVCTKENPRTDTTGVDCSGFVSEVWGLSRHVSTSQFPNIANQLGDIAELQGADVLVKPGDHMLLFIRWRADGQMEMINSAVGWCKGHVCRKIGRAGEFEQLGYLPFGYGSGT